MNVAIIGSRNITNIPNLDEIIPIGTSKIISGGAIGIDTIAKEYAINNKIPLVEIFPDYKKFGKFAPIKRNDTIIDLADYVIALWDGKSHGTQYVINQCIKVSKPVKVLIC